MTIHIPTTARDLGIGPFPPFVIYANAYDQAMGDLLRVQDYIGQAIACLDRVPSLLTGTYTDGQTITNAPTDAQQQIGFALTWIQGAQTLMGRMGCPCPNFYPVTGTANYPGWNGDYGAVAGPLATAAANIGDFNLGPTGQITVSSHRQTLINARSVAGSMRARIDSTGCRNNDQFNTGTGGGGDPGDGGISGGPG